MSEHYLPTSLPAAQRVIVEQNREIERLQGVVASQAVRAKRDRNSLALARQALRRLRRQDEDDCPWPMIEQLSEYDV